MRPSGRVTAEGLPALILLEIVYDLRTRCGVRELACGVCRWTVRTRGRPHSVYVLGGALMLAVQVMRGPVSATQWWYAVADFLARFSG